MLIDLDDNEIHRILECLDYVATCMGTNDEDADDCERIWRKIFNASGGVKMESKDENLTELDKSISRLEIIGATAGRLFVKWSIEIEQISIQDEGRTMKIFIKNKELT